jgi:8-oxo-dGTP diphosphatase
MAILHGWKVCPRCSTPLDLGEMPARVSCASCGFVAYANPKPTASALVVDGEGRLLLARRAIEPFRGFWDTPGGFVEEGEHPLAALRRELLEETGLVVEPGEFHGVWMDSYGGAPDAQSTLNLYWEARVVSGVMQAADDVAELRWFAPIDLPPSEELAFTTLAQALAAWREIRP